MWKTIKRVGYPYQVNAIGEIRNARTGTVFRLNDRSGYLGVGVRPDGSLGKCIRLRAHRCVAEEFLDGYFEGAVVNHKDGNKHNNALENLEWVTCSENIKHTMKLGLLKHKSKFKSPKCRITKEQLQYVKDNMSSRSIRSISRELGFSHSSILNALKW